MVLDPESLVNHVAGALQRAMRRCNDFAIDFDASLASTLLAALAREHSDVPVYLVSVPRRGQATDLRARARRLRLPLCERRIVENGTAADERLPGVATTRFDQVAREARLVTGRLLLTRMTPPVPIGEERVAESLGLQLRWPLLDARVQHVLAGGGRDSAASSLDRRLEAALLTLGWKEDSPAV